jgi:hypothetical protein
VGHLLIVLTRPPRLHQDDAKDAQWFDVDSLPELAFDHKLVVRRSLRHLAAQPEAKQTGTPLLAGACAELFLGQRVACLQRWTMYCSIRS